MEPTIKTTVPR